MQTNELHSNRHPRKTGARDGREFRPIAVAVVAPRCSRFACSCDVVVCHCTSQFVVAPRFDLAWGATVGRDFAFPPKSTHG